MPISLKSIYSNTSGIKLGAGVTLPDFNDEGIGKFIYTGVNVSSGTNIVNLEGKWVVYNLSVSGLDTTSGNISCTISVDGVQKLNTTQPSYTPSTANIIGSRAPSNVNQVDIANRQGITCDNSFVVNMTKALSTNCTITLYAYPLE